LSEEQANAIAVYYENCFNEEILSDATRAVGSKKANALGIFDLAGNVCEWVIPQDSARVARGGHFMSDRDELGVGRHLEDSDKWNMSYPNEPKSIWWFVDAKWLGFRVVCDATSVYNKVSGGG
jgi:formylglycine-generating enzyme required for sulfatase activity